MTEKIGGGGMKLIAAVEGGGTTFVISVARILPPSSSTTTNNNNNEDDDENILHMAEGQTLQLLSTKTISSSSDPTDTMNACCSFLKQHGRESSNIYLSIGICCFGPVGVDPNDEESYGFILQSCTKKSWRGIQVVQPLLEAASSSEGGVPPPHWFDTDVNAPAMAEYQYFCSQVIKHNNSIDTTTNPNSKKKKKKMPSSVAYITVGTGVGIGLVINSLPVHGMMHPEGGQIITSPLKGDTFQEFSWGKQSSPYGGVYTVEGIASAVALTERLTQMQQQQQQQNQTTSTKTTTPTTTTTKEEDNNNNINNKGDNEEGAKSREQLKDLSNDHILWDHASNALANACVTLALLVSIEKIVLGGGIMQRTSLYNKIRLKTKELLNGYLIIPGLENEDSDEDGFIVPSVWKHRAGLAGAYALALKALNDNENNNENNNNNKKDVKMEKSDDDNDDNNNIMTSFKTWTVLGISLAVLSTAATFWLRPKK